MYFRTRFKDASLRIEPARATRPKQLPTVLTKQKALAVIERLRDPYQTLTGLQMVQCALKHLSGSRKPIHGQLRRCDRQYHAPRLSP